MKLKKNILDLIQDAGVDMSHLQTNANEVEHTGNTGQGEELIPVDVLLTEIIDMIPKFGSFIGSLPGNHGTSMPKSAKVAVIGDIPYFKGNSEWTTGAGAIAQGNSLLPTAEVTITQGQFISSVDISKRELTYSIGNIEALVKQRISEAAAQTVESIIINGDSEPGATGNVNLDDDTPDSAVYYLQNDGSLRELGINLTQSTAIGTFDQADLITIQSKLGKLSADRTKCMWLFETDTYNKLQGVQAFYDASQRGEKSTLSGNAITNILGSDVFITPHMNLTEADGKISTTAGNNTKGQLIYFYKPAIQYGWGQTMELDVVKVFGKGISVIATFEFGFAIANKKAGQTIPALWIGRDITL